MSQGPGALGGLTPQELHRTVGYHLYNAYPKLGVVSRGELADVVGTPGNHR